MRAKGSKDAMGAKSTKGCLRHKGYKGVTVTNCAKSMERYEGHKCYKGSKVCKFTKGAFRVEMFI